MKMTKLIQNIDTCHPHPPNSATDSFHLQLNPTQPGIKILNKCLRIELISTHLSLIQFFLN